MCLASSQRDEILKAVRARDRQEREAALQNGEISRPLARRTELDNEELTDFICSMCTKGGICMGCLKTAVEPEQAHSSLTDARGDPSALELDKPGEAAASKDTSMSSQHAELNELLFRCVTCRRLAHYVSHQTRF
jgi:chromodomain-helicase-DNA-binding protein 4